MMIDISEMFRSATLFNQSLSNWNVENVMNMDMIFLNAISFRQSLLNWKKETRFIANNDTIREAVNLWCDERYIARTRYGSIENWDVSEVSDMSELFKDKPFFNDSIATWNVSNVTVMSRMFQNAREFNQELDVWDVVNVTVMTDIFDGAVSFNRSITSWENKLKKLRIKRYNTTNTWH